MNKTFLVIGAIILVGFIGYGVYQNDDMMPEDAQKIAMMKAEADAMAMKEKEAMMASTSGDKMMEDKMDKDGQMMKGDAMMAKTAGMYVPYSADKLALAKENKVIIFFHASWCPTCRALEAEINSKGVKDGYVILKVDYDTAKDLKSKYGVTSQHTLVQVNTSGEALMKWSGGDLANIYAKAK